MDAECGGCCGDFVAIVVFETWQGHFVVSASCLHCARGDTAETTVIFTPNSEPEGEPRLAMIGGKIFSGKK